MTLPTHTLRGESFTLQLDDRAQIGSIRFGGREVALPLGSAWYELDDEGGVTARFHRYSDNQRQLVDGLADLGIQSLIERRYQSPIITSFLYPADARFTFEEFYRRMKERRFVLYPGKVSQAPTFRIGTIGHVFPEDIQRLVRCVSDVLDEMGIVRETRVAR